MSKALSVSLVIVSRNRPKELRLVLTSLRYLDYSEFEVIVVGTDNPATAFPDVYNVNNIKFVPYDAPNISAARNMGINAAAGAIVAFCDDDAVPEPSWLTHLTACFSNPNVAAAGGYVRGRNGISFQWRGRTVDNFGRHADIVHSGSAPVVLQGDAFMGIKTEGTNCAFRRDALKELGGFDENFHYYLDETDLNIRVGAKGWHTAIVPLAQVHHGFAPSTLRSKNRAPRSLFEVGASSAYYWKKHGREEGWQNRKAEIIAEHKGRLVEFMVNGLIEPFEIKRLLVDLNNGFGSGIKRSLSTGTVLIGPQKPDFKVFCSNPKTTKAGTIAGRPIYWRRAKKLALDFALEGRIMTVFALSLTSAFHRVSFNEGGYWLHTGGIFGRSSRGDRIFRMTTFKKRVDDEISMLADIRPTGRISYLKSK